MAMGDTGLVLSVLSHTQETEDILVMKKSVAAAFSHHRQVSAMSIQAPVLVVDANGKSSQFRRK